MDQSQLLLSMLTLISEKVQVRLRCRVLSYGAAMLQLWHSFYMEALTAREGLQEAESVRGEGAWEVKIKKRIINKNHQPSSWTC